MATLQPPLAESLPPLQAGAEVDCVVVGCGPAGLALAAALGGQGLSVGLIAPDTPFTNNYGVWYDEFESLGLQDALSHVYEDVLVWMHQGDPAGETLPPSLPPVPFPSDNASRLPASLLSLQPCLPLSVTLGCGGWRMQEGGI